MTVVCEAYAIPPANVTWFINGVELKSRFIDSSNIDSFNIDSFNIVNISIFFSVFAMLLLVLTI